jgi:hypothetical protein
MKTGPKGPGTPVLSSWELNVVSRRICRHKQSLSLNSAGLPGSVPQYLVEQLSLVPQAVCVVLPKS